MSPLFYAVRVSALQVLRHGEGTVMLPLQYVFFGVP